MQNSRQSMLSTQLTLGVGTSTVQLNKDMSQTMKMSNKPSKVMLPQIKTINTQKEDFEIKKLQLNAIIEAHSGSMRDKHGRIKGFKIERSKNNWAQGVRQGGSIVRSSHIPNVPSSSGLISQGQLKEALRSPQNIGIS